MQTATTTFRKHPLISHATLLLVALVAYLLISTSMISLVMGIVVSYLFSRHLLNKEYFPTKVFVFVASVFGYASALQISAYLIVLFGTPVDLRVSVLLTQALFSTLWLLTRMRPIPNLRRSSWFDGVALGVTLIFIGAMVIIPIRKAGGFSESSAIELMNAGVDDSAHLTIFNQRIDSKVGVITNEDQLQNPRYKVNLSYPAGWHAANAAITLSINPQIKTGYETIVAYVISKMAWLGYLSYVFIAACGILAGNIPKKHRAVVVYWHILMSIFVTFWLLAIFPFIGFYNFTPILVAVPLMMLAVASVMSTERLTDTLSQLMFPILIVCAAALSWVLIAPAFALAGLIGAIVAARGGYARQMRRVESRTIIAFTVVAAIAAIAVLMQVKLTSTLTSEFSFKESINIPGGMAQLPVGLYIVLLVLSVPFILQSLRTSQNKNAPLAHKGILSVLLSLTLFTSSLYALQMYSTGTNTYYFYKPLAIVALGIVIASTVGVSRLISSTRFDMFAGYSSITILVMIITTVIYPNPEFFKYAITKNTMSPQVSTFIARQFNGDFSRDNYSNRVVAVFATGPSTHVYAEIGNMLLRSNKPYSSCYDYLHRETMSTQASDLSIKSLFTNKCDGYRVIIYTDQSAADRLTHDASAVGASNYRFSAVQ